MNKVSGHVIYVDCSFEDEDGTLYHEEDYIDLKDVLAEFGSVLYNMYYVQIGPETASKKEQLIRDALLVSDNIAILYHHNPDIPDTCVKTVSLARPSSYAVIRLKDFQVVESTMSEALLKRSVAAVKRNQEEIAEEVEEVLKYA